MQPVDRRKDAGKQVTTDRNLSELEGNGAGNSNDSSKKDFGTGRCPLLELAQVTLAPAAKVRFPPSLPDAA